MRGTYTVAIDGHIIVSHIIGQWNLRTAENYSAEISKLIKQHTQPTFAHLVNFEHWQLGTPEASAYLKKQLDFLIARGMRRSAEILEQNTLKDFAIVQVIEGASPKLIIKRFATSAEGYAWLSQQGYNTAQEIIAKPTVAAPSDR